MTEKIDNFFDVVDRALGGADRVLNRSKYAEDKLKTPQESNVKVKVPSPYESSTAIATRRFHIIEALDAQTGETIFTVTDGNSSAACSTRELAERLLRALESVA